jgi:hypothetical protein
LVKLLNLNNFGKYFLSKLLIIVGLNSFSSQEILGSRVSEPHIFPPQRSMFDMRSNASINKLAPNLLSGAADMDLQQLMRFSNFLLHTQRAWSRVEKLESSPKIWHWR